ncbi:MAG TPA: NlpC/P60 family protein [Accumulibacter sp.]|jgi:cell wall-associated NlpC family hydrolase|uniref:NlpC/P60 family protein n=1 Tax=Accumulibacter sp. TaxID=2053492 RepID=UPI002C197857|nr:NlpC/P60 family protein [Accumulibacter sp.]HRF74157.1 NlpC/P60 family protein [Accumulibacter sp.]
MTADQIVAAARACLGTPFRHQGRQPGANGGIDCAGLVVHVAGALGCSYLDQEGYGTLPANGLLEAALDAQPCLERVFDIDAKQPGDVLLMRFTGEPQHLAILAGETLIHAWEAPGLCCEHNIDATWLARIVRVYRFVGVV